MFLSGLKYLKRLERQVKFAKNRCCKIKPVAVLSELLFMVIFKTSTIKFYRTFTVSLDMRIVCLNVMKIEVIFKILKRTLKMYNVVKNYTRCSLFLSATLIFCECLITELL